ncbi:MAG: hypothetical protein ACKVON_16385 [Beijerinckiaceae bacterium]
MRFETIFVAFGVIAGAGLSLLGLQAPALFKSAPALMWLLGAILLFDIASAYLRGVPVMTSVSTTTRVFGFCGGALALILSGGLWS